MKRSDFSRPSDGPCHHPMHGKSHPGGKLRRTRCPGRLAALAFSVTAGLGVSACMSPPERPALRVEPNYRLQHAGAGLAQGYALLAQRYEGEARWPEALQAWQKAVQAAPDDADLHNALGQAQAGLGEHEAAVRTFRRAVQLAPDQPGLHNNLGYALMRAGRDEEARAALLQALALQPGYARAAANLRRLETAAATPLAPAPETSPVPAPVSETAQATARVETAMAVVGTGTPETTQAYGQTLAAQQGSPASFAAPTARPAPAVEIANGNGVEGMAACMAEALRSRGAVGRTRLRNALPYDTGTTVVRYRPGHAQAAQALANQLPGSAPAVPGLDRADSLDLRIVLGHDLRASGLCARRG